MKVTFPHMGNTHIAIKCLLQGLKLEVVPPPPITARTLELGAKYSPEFACLPMKINIGNFIEAIEKGADTVVMAGGWGPCRFGYYAQVERLILEDIGYKFSMYVLEAPDSKLLDLFKQVKELGGNVSFLEAMQAIKFAWYKLNAAEEMEKKLEYYLPRALEKDLAESIYDGAIYDIDQAGSRREVDQIRNRAENEFKNLPAIRGRIVRIGLVGEIYTILEPRANYDIIRHLGRLNAEISRSIYITDWVNEHLMAGKIKKSQHRHIVKYACPYLNYWVGGHGLETVGYTVGMARSNYDGIVQIAPLTCMPEIVAHSILGRVSEAEKIPCMTLYFDEHSGNAGIKTRLEAFIDMLYRKLKVLNA